MNAPSAAIAQRPPLTRGARAYRWILGLLFIALTVPYASGFIQWSAAEGLFPIRPAFYLILVAGSSLAFSLLARPDLTLTSLAILALLTFYLFDMAALNRFVVPGEKGEEISSYGSHVVHVATMACLIGVMHRLKMKTPLLIGAALIILLCSGSAIVEMFGFYEFTDDPGRAAGFRIDANDACIAMVLSLSIFLTLSEKPSWSFAMIGITFLGAIVTLSRSGMIALTLVTTLFLANEFRRNPRAVIRLSFVAVPILIVGTAWLMKNLASENKGSADVSDRMSAMYGGDFGKMASGERMKDLMDGVDALIEKPVFGHGAGAGTMLWRPHNQLVATWIDGGIITGGLYLGILFSICVKTVRAKFQGGLVVISLLIFIPFSQAIMFDMGYWLAALFVLLHTSRKVFCLQLYRPQPSETLAISQGALS